MLILVHMILMITAAVCFIVGVALAMFLRKKSYWLKMHKKLNSIGFFLLLSGGILAFVNILINNGTHFNGLHQIVGLGAIVFTSVTLLLGFYQFKAKDKLTIRTTHRWLGRLSLLLVIIALMLGLLLAGII